MSFNYNEPLFCENTGCFVGVGIGLGLFSSVFASVAIFMIVTTWMSCCQQTEWGGGIICMVVFRTLFSLPFLAPPAIIGLFLGVWLVTLIGYLMPFVYFGCFWCNKRNQFSIKNPMVNNNQNNNNYDTTTNTNVYTYGGGNNNNNDDNHEVKQWLNDIGLGEYYQTLKYQGYETVDDVLTITDNDLKELGITKQMHVKKIMNKINGQNGIAMTVMNDGNDDIPPPYAVHHDDPPAYGGEGEGGQQTYQ